jgi:hypothetical protein
MMLNARAPVSYLHSQQQQGRQHSRSTRSVVRAERQQQQQQAQTEETLYKLRAASSRDVEFIKQRLLVERCVRTGRLPGCPAPGDCVACACRARAPTVRLPCTRPAPRDA